MQAHMLSFRGLWRIGVYYHVGDVVARGPRSFEATVDHVAGTQSEPASGADWGRYWKPSEGVAYLREPPPVAQPAQPLSVIPFPLAAPPLPVAHHAPGAAIAQPAPPPKLPIPIGPDPSRMPAASEIADDSESGGLNVAFALDAIRQRLDRAVRQDDLQAALLSIAARLDRLEARQPDAELSDNAFDAVTAEAWRRKCEVLQVPTIAAARAQIDGMTREMLRMLRKRDKGGAFTPLEASRIAILDQYDQYLEEIDARADVLAIETPPDITNDRHWPKLGGA